jgi:serine/threonine protein kinase/tetratricopeptide (TPR) repeat protein
VTDESIFAAALAIADGAQRAAYLDRACAGNATLRREVEALLAAHASDNPLDRPPADLGRTGAYEPAADELPAASVGDRVGPYRLMEQIGEGGFGLVFVAEQTAPVRRKVALKVLKPGMDTRDVVARFEAERQALALMDHPNIAKVLDAGSTPAGRPYFAMELVKGVPITDYCDGQKLPPRERLALFVQVCQAVQHAHQKGVIHRDLKPSNVLVTVIDGRAVPKVIDFGVAKALGQSLTDKTVYTRFAQMIGTPLYMSPEQAELSGVDVDTRADVYALGVLLYELLTGTTPFDRDRFRKAAFDEIRRIIREEEPPRPSTRLSSLGQTLSAVSASRGTDPAKLAGLVRGELDWIVMKCLEKDRGRRYETTNGLARDVQRYLADEVVEARPPSTGYRLRKFLRRNKGPVLVATALAVSLLAGGAGILAVEVRAERDQAAAAADRAAREAGTTASIDAAVREARQRAAEAWDLHDYPDRMRLATDAAREAIKRADGFVAGGTPTDEAVAELAAARREVDELARHTRLVTSCVANQRKFAEDLNSGGGDLLTRGRFARRHREALRQFGLDVVGGDADEVARSIAASRLRDPLLGMLLEWQVHEVAALNLWRKYQKQEKQLPERIRQKLRTMPVPDPLVKDRLEQVIRSSRRLCGGAYARWQDLLDRKDVPGLVAFAASPDGLSFGSTLVVALGRDLTAANELSACRQLLRAAVDRYPHDVWLQFNLNQSCLGSQPPSLAEALRHIAAASVQWPDCGLFHIHIGFSYMNLGCYDEAVAAFRKATSLYTKSGIAHYYLGQALRQKKDLDGAVAALREAVRLSPTDTYAKSLLEVVLKERQKWDGAQAGPKPDLDRLQGKWERVSSTESSPFGNAQRAIKEIKGNKETVTFYDDKGQVVRSHRVSVQLAQTGKVRTFSYTNMEILDGPNKGQKTSGRGSYIYVLDGDRFYEANNLLTTDGPDAPDLSIWKRVRQKKSPPSDAK